MHLGSLLQAFLKVGAVGFGGGSALIPVIEKEVVQNRGLLDTSAYEEHIVASNLTPGTLPVKLAAAAGQALDGPVASFLSAVAVALPGTAATVLLLAGISRLSGEALLWLELAAVGILTFILMILYAFIKGVQKNARRDGFGGTAMFAMLGSGLLMAGKELRVLAHILVPASGSVISDVPLFDLSAMNVLMLAFFAIFGTNGNPSRLRKAAVVVIGVLYALLMGNAGWIQVPYALPVVGAVMMGFVVYAIAKDIKDNGQNGSGMTKISIKPILAQIALFLGVPLLLCALCVVLGYADAGFFGQGALSTITSFGSGEAYVAVADGVFVGGGYIPREVLYTRLLPIINALPGLILVKLLAGIGYAVGSVTGGVPGGLLTATACAFTGIGATGAIFAVVYAVYRCFAGLTVFTRLKKLVLPVVCGLLLTTMLTMVESMLLSCLKAGWHVVGSIVLMVALAAAGRFLTRKKWPDAVCVLGLGVLAALVFWVWFRFAA